jgi:hypothetical protein
MEVPQAAKGATRSSFSIRLSMGVCSTDDEEEDDEGSMSQITVSPVATHDGSDAIPVMIFVSSCFRHGHVDRLLDGRESNNVRPGRRRWRPPLAPRSRAFLICIIKVENSLKDSSPSERGVAHLRSTQTLMRALSDCLSHSIGKIELKVIALWI